MLLLRDQVTEIIMVSYFRPNDLLRSVESILKHTDEPYHLSIIDNSRGGINNILLKLTDEHITIHSNEANIGKGRSFGRWYETIMKSVKSDAFVSIDSDIEVQASWLTKFKIAAARNIDFGILAPTIVNSKADSFESQLVARSFVMHKFGGNFRLTNGILLNRFIAGPLLYINRKFYEKVGGYVQTQLYGNDDGELCKAATKHNKLTGIVPEIVVQHLNEDSTEGYQNWKYRHVRLDTPRGYWG